jgi:hypothetical protein
MKRYNVSANRYNGFETIITVQTGMRVRARATGGGYTGAGKRVQVQQVFSKKN